MSWESDYFDQYRGSASGLLGADYYRESNYRESNYRESNYREPAPDAKDRKSAQSWAEAAESVSDKDGQILRNMALVRVKAVKAVDVARSAYSGLSALWHAIGDLRVAIHQSTSRVNDVESRADERFRTLEREIDNLKHRLDACETRPRNPR